MKYFGHDCNAGDDPKLIKVILKFGMEGYGVYFRCLEFIATKLTEHNLECVLEHDLELLEDMFKMSQERISNILEYLVVVGLFDKTVNGKYRCLKLLTRIDEYTKKRMRNLERGGPGKVRIVSGQSPVK